MKAIALTTAANYPPCPKIQGEKTKPHLQVEDGCLNELGLLQLLQLLFFIFINN
jgi:hypothetical protein